MSHEFCLVCKMTKNGHSTHYCLQPHAWSLPCCADCSYPSVTSRPSWHWWKSHCDHMSFIWYHRLFGYREEWVLTARYALNKARGPIHLSTLLYFSFSLTEGLITWILRTKTKRERGGWKQAVGHVWLGKIVVGGFVVALTKCVKCVPNAYGTRSMAALSGV